MPYYPPSTGGSGGPSAAGTLTGTTLAPNVVTSSLTTVGTLSVLAVTGNANVITGSAVAGGAALWTITPGAHTAVVAEVIDWSMVAHTITITGGYATQRFMNIGVPTISAATSQTVTTAATFAIAGSPIAAGAGPAIITTPLSLWVQGGAVLFAGVGALSNPPLSLTGTWLTSTGTATTTKPQFLVEPSGTTSTNWSTNGTGIGVNAATGFVGNLLDLQLVAVSKWRVTQGGSSSQSGSVTATQGIFNAAGTSLTTSGGFVELDNGTVTGAALAATLSKTLGVVTTEVLTTAALTGVTYTITNTKVAAVDVVIVQVSTLGTGIPVVASVIPGAGSFTVQIYNVAAAAAFNAALKIEFQVFKTA